VALEELRGHRTVVEPDAVAADQAFTLSPISEGPIWRPPNAPSADRRWASPKRALLIGMLERPEARRSPRSGSGSAGCRTRAPP